MSPSISSHRSRRGVALVITLILLSVILVITLALLAVSRRERSSVTTAQQLIEADMMASGAAERAKATLAAQIMGRTNMMAGGVVRPIYGSEIAPLQTLTPLDGHLGGELLVSTSTNSFDPSRYNLDYITNLQFDARPPVFVRTNFNSALPNAPLEFRHFLDLNRNGLFESNGFFQIFDTTEQAVGTNRFFHSGDPEWIGVLAQPGLPHSASNRFIGRYAFMVLPAGRSLDLNTIHNDAKNADMNSRQEGYGRNMGYGTYEINLAAFLADLNTNYWGLPNAYQFDLSPPWGLGKGIGAGDGQGLAFDQARNILRFRYDGDHLNLPTLQNYWGTASGLRAENAFASDNIDTYADDNNNTVTNRAGGGFTFENDLLNKNVRWPGVDNIRRFDSVNDLFKAPSADPNSFPYFGEFTRDLNRASTNKGTYNRYTFYRMLSQIGTDAGTGGDDRINLNYKNTEGIHPSQFLTWTPSNFFMTVADRLLKQTFSNISPDDLFSQNVASWYSPTGLVRVMPKPPLTQLYASNLFELTSISATNIPVYPTNYYNPTVHRLLQLSANLYEATTNRFGPPRNTLPPNHAALFPSVYRPILAKRANNHVVITGYEEDDGGIELHRRRWGTLQDFLTGQISVQDNVFGIPPIIAARKGFPSLNEVSVASVVDVTRKLLVTKNALNDDLRKKPFTLNEAYLISISNTLAFEFLNPYTSPYPRRLQLEIKGRLTSFLTDGRTVLQKTTNNYAFTNFFPANTWKGGLLSLTGIQPQPSPRRDFPFISAALYDPFSRTLSYSITNPVFRRKEEFATAQFMLRTTNEFSYVLLDMDARTSVDTPRVVDAVSMRGLDTALDITRFLYGYTDANNVDGAGVSLNLWDTNRLGDQTSISARTRGATNQITVSLDPSRLGNPSVEFKNYLRLETRADEVANFTEFFYGGKSNDTLQKQTPFSAYKTFYQILSWQANDPLLHHIPEQLMSPWAKGSEIEFGTNYGIPEAKRYYAYNVNGRPLNVGLSNVIVQDWNIDKVNEHHLSWDSRPLGLTNEFSWDPGIKDPEVRIPEQWNFPTNAYANVGWIGRVHRGTPWQTVYLKSGKPSNPAWIYQTAVDVKRAWRKLDGKYESAFMDYPTNDWLLVDQFTVSPNDNSSIGAIGVNQTGLAAWSAVLSGVVVQTNNANANDTLNRANRGLAPAVGLAAIQPALGNSSAGVVKIVNGINRVRSQLTNGLFATAGQLLSVPELTMDSPFLQRDDPRFERFRKYGITEEAYERIPQQILSLVRTDQPRFVVYAFGQALQPAPNSLIQDPRSGFYNLCTNYQITAEAATKTVLHFENLGPRPTPSPRTRQQIILTPVIDSFEQLPADGL